MNSQVIHESISENPLTDNIVGISLEEINMKQGREKRSKYLF